MRVILLTSNYNISANIALKHFLENNALKKHKIDVMGLISASTFDFNRWGIKMMAKFIEKSGWGFFLKNVITSMWQRFCIGIGKWLIPNKYREFFSIKELAEMHEIPYLKVSDINSAEAKTFMKKSKPTYLVSCFLLQIVDKEVLAIPSKGAINCHPSLIQKHRGLFTSFWALLKNWKRSGATVHFMTEKPDEGKIILQKRFFVSPSDTIYCVNKRSAILGANLLVKALINLKRKKARALMFKKLGEMFSIPTVKDVKAFYLKGRSIIKVRDFFRI